MVAFVERHPILSAIVGVIVFVVLYVIVSGSGGGTDTQSSLTDAAIAGNMADQQNQAALQALNIQYGAAKDIANIQSAQNISLATIAAQLQGTEAGYTHEENLANLNAQRDVALSTLTVQSHIAELNASVQNNQIASVTQQAQINASVAKAAIKAKSSSSNLGSIASIAGMAAMMFI